MTGRLRSARSNLSPREKRLTHTAILHSTSNRSVHVAQWSDAICFDLTQHCAYSFAHVSRSFCYAVKCPSSHVPSPRQRPRMARQ
eukprot:4888048-Pleurochrysis_carterae.AAC.1